MANENGGLRGPEASSNREARIIHLFGLLAFAVQELKRLGMGKSSIEVHRAILQLRFESAPDLEEKIQQAFRASGGKVTFDTEIRTSSCNALKRRYN